MGYLTVPASFLCEHLGAILLSNKTGETPRAQLVRVGVQEWLDQASRDCLPTLIRLLF